MSESEVTQAKWFVYILRCSDDSLYTGITLDVPKRIAAHLGGKGSRCLRGKLPLKLVYQEAHTGRSAALKREAMIKRLTHTEKEALILIHETTCG